MSHRKTTQCPNCGNGKTGIGGGWRYCPVCGWSNKPKGKIPENKRKVPIKEPESKHRVMRCNHIPETVGRNIVCKKCKAVLEVKAAQKDQPKITRKLEISSKAKTDIKKPKNQITLQR